MKTLKYRMCGGDGWRVSNITLGRHGKWHRVVHFQQLSYRFKSKKCVYYYLRILQRRKWKVKQHSLGKVEFRIYCIQHPLTNMHARSPHCLCGLSSGGQMEWIKGTSNPISIWNLASWPRDVHELNEQCLHRKARGWGSWGENMDSEWQ